LKLLPLAIFAVFVFLSLLVTIYALVTKSYLSPDERAAPATATSR
jgi:hypothetical protein